MDEGGLTLHQQLTRVGLELKILQIRQVLISGRNISSSSAFFFISMEKPLCASNAILSNVFLRYIFLLYVFYYYSLVKQLKGYLDMHPGSSKKLKLQPYIPSHISSLRRNKKILQTLFAFVNSDMNF
jgi:hypothetical protein